jgi:hypothetical protein
MLLGIETYLNEVQPKNAPSISISHPLISFTPSGIITSVKEEQLEKTSESRIFTLLEIVTEVKLEHHAKALYPISVTLLGMVMEVNLEQPQNV